VEFTSGGALGSLIYWQGSFDFSTGIALYTNTTGSISAQATFLPPTSSIAAVTTATTFGDGKPHHLVATFVDASTAPLIYVDGVAQATTPTVLGTPCPFAANQAYVGSAPTAALGSLFAGTVDEVAVYNSVLSSGHVLDHYNQGTIPWVGDTVATRAARYLTLVGWPSADQDLNGATVLQQVALGRLPALTALQDLERAEQGQLYIDGIGKIEFRDRYWRYTDSHAITSQATFGDAGIGLELGYSDLVTDGGEQFIANTVITQRFGGGEQTREDVTSQTMFYERTLSITGLQNSDDADVGYIADWQLATHKNVIQRVTQLSVRPLGNPAALFPVVLGLDIGQRVTVKRRPQGVGAVLTYTMLVEGIVHTFDATGEWTTTFYLSSADSTLLTGIYDDAVYGLYDSAVFAP
jgi:hypothetical protein